MVVLTFLPNPTQLDIRCLPNKGQVRELWMYSFTHICVEQFMYWRLGERSSDLAIRFECCRL